MRGLVRQVRKPSPKITSMRFQVSMMLSSLSFLPVFLPDARCMALPTKMAKDRTARSAGSFWSGLSPEFPHGWMKFS